MKPLVIGEKVADVEVPQGLKELDSGCRLGLCSLKDSFEEGRSKPANSTRALYKPGRAPWFLKFSGVCITYTPVHW